MKEGFSARPVLENGKTVWIVISIDGQRVLAKGDTISEAVAKLEEKDGEVECPD